jgi:hypothetical protein
VQPAAQQSGSASEARVEPGSVSRQIFVDSIARVVHPGVGRLRWRAAQCARIARALRKSTYACAEAWCCPLPAISASDS